MFDSFNFNINIDFLLKILAFFKKKKNTEQTQAHNMNSGIVYATESRESSISIPPNSISKTNNTEIKTGLGSIMITGKASITQKS